MHGVLVWAVSQGVGFSEGGHRVRKDGARLGELAGGEIKGGIPVPRTGCLYGTTLVSIVSALKKLTSKSPGELGWPGLTHLALSTKNISEGCPFTDTLSRQAFRPSQKFI